MLDSDEPRILCVDDEPNVLEGLERTLFEHFDVVTALGGAEGLEALKEEGPFAAVVSDMRMPQMNGAEFLAKVRQKAPDTVRLLLTGQADMESTIAAVNEGNIFRFLSKPCPKDALVRSLEDAVRQYRLVNAERELLENTVSGAVQVLSDVLSLAAPVAFSRSSQIKAYVMHMCEKFSVENPWMYGMAAMLSQIGCITLPPDTMDKVFAGRAVSDDEREMFRGHPAIGQRLLQRIPRLESVAAMIGGQMNGKHLTNREERLGAEMLNIARGVDRRVTAGNSLSASIALLQKKRIYHAELLACLADFKGQAPTSVIRALHVRELRTFMTFDEDVRSTTGNVIVPKGHEVTAALIERLNNFARGIGIQEPIRVRVPPVITDEAA